MSIFNAVKIGSDQVEDFWPEDMKTESGEPHPLAGQSRIRNMSEEELLNREVGEALEQSSKTKEQKQQDAENYKLEKQNADNKTLSKEFVKHLSTNKKALESYKKTSPQEEINDSSIEEATGLHLHAPTIIHSLTKGLSFPAILGIYKDKLPLDTGSPLQNYLEISRKYQSHAKKVNDYVRATANNAKNYSVVEALEAHAHKVGPVTYKNARKMGIDHKTIIDVAKKGHDMPTYTEGVERGYKPKEISSLMDIGLGKNNNKWDHWQLGMTTPGVTQNHMTDAMKNGMNLLDYVLNRRDGWSHEDTIKMNKIR